MHPKKQKLIDYWKSHGIITDPRVLDAFAKVPREDFLPEHLKDNAYEDRALPIEKNQTISQPTTVMIMTQALDIQPNHKVLEVGTGSGYQAAILAQLADKGIVYTTEIIKELCEYSKRRLKKYQNVHVFHRDGIEGVEEFAPFDRIIITAACPEMPKPLINHLSKNGIIIAPVGTQYVQKMIIGIKKGKNFSTHSIGEFVFVPLTGKYGFTV